jgi:hypothetical protein
MGRPKCRKPSAASSPSRDGQCSPGGFDTDMLDVTLDLERLE